MKSEIEHELFKLKDSNLSQIVRSVNMGGFTFISPKKEQFHLHVQCPWRIVIDNEIYIANGDMYLPSSDFSGGWDEFDWDVAGANLFDERALSYENSEFCSLCVTDVAALDFGGVEITFGETGYMQIFVNCSAAEEQWRFFEYNLDEEHFVVTPLGIDI